jgi:hypothetical protein
MPGPLAKHRRRDLPARVAVDACRIDEEFPCRIFWHTLRQVRHGSSRWGIASRTFVDGAWQRCRRVESPDILSAMTPLREVACFWHSPLEMVARRVSERAKPGGARSRVRVSRRAGIDARVFCNRRQIGLVARRVSEGNGISGQNSSMSLATAKAKTRRLKETQKTKAQNTGAFCNLDLDFL